MRSPISADSQAHLSTTTSSPSTSPDTASHEIALEDASRTETENEDSIKSSWRRLIDRLFADWWMWELLGLLWGLLCLLIIVAFFIIYDNRPQDDWPYSFTLNSAVALICTVAKLGFMSAQSAALGQLRWNWYSKPHPLGDWVTFDAASRGSPYGSAKLIWKLFGLRLAPVGAFVSLAAIFFSSLTQQGIAYRTFTEVSESGTASLARTFGFTAEVTEPFDVDGAPIDFIAVSDSKMLAAVSYVAYNASLDVEMGFGLSKSCSTGTCYFGIFSSLGACSQCVDLTSEVETNCNGGTCSYVLSTPDAILSTGNVLNTTTGQSIYTTLNVSSVSQIASDFGIFNITSLYTNYTSQDNSQLINPSRGVTLAQRCRISLCVKMYNSSIINGVFNETVLNRTLLSSANITPNGTITHLPIPSGNLPPNASLSISPGSLQILGRSLEGIYNGAVVIAPSTSTNTTSTTAYVIGYTSTTLQGLYNNNSISVSTTASNIATTITNIIRSQGATDDFLVGRASSTQSYLRVAWPWVIYPLGLWLLILVFVVATIVKTHFSAVQYTWKSDPLALLFHGLETDDRALRHLHELGKLHQMSALGKKLRVKLKKSRDRRRLVCAKGEDSEQSSEEE